MSCRILYSMKLRRAKWRLHPYRKSESFIALFVGLYPGQALASGGIKRTGKIWHAPALSTFYLLRFKLTASMQLPHPRPCFQSSHYWRQAGEGTDWLSQEVLPHLSVLPLPAKCHQLPFYILYNYIFIYYTSIVCIYQEISQPACAKDNLFRSKGWC